MPAGGLSFHEESEIAELDTRDYGSTFVSEAYVRKAVEQASGGRSEYHRIKRVMYYQDLYVLVNSDHADFSGLKFRYGPGGTLDYCYWSRRDELCISGWNVDVTPGSSIEEISIFVNGQLRQKCIPFGRRPDVRNHFKDEAFLYSGWECCCYVPGAADTDLLTATIKTTGGNEYLLYAGSIAAVLRPLEGDATSQSSIRNAEQHISQLESQLESTKAEFVELESYARRLEAELNAARGPRLPWKRRSGNG